MNQVIPRRVVDGIQVLLFHDGPYVEVAERVRLVHTMGKRFCVHRVETFPIKKQWMYRVHLCIDQHQYIGDAEIHFGAPKETPDGTHPISCGQTSAIGNALTFAGFGDIRLLLDRLDQSSDALAQTYPCDPPYGVIEGVRVIWFDDTPYVPVAERLYHLHTCGWAFSIERCEIVEVNGISLYRVRASVNGQSYVGDAEIHFDAPETFLDRRYPVSTAQTCAIGNVLALAGFGDVRSILERAGRDASGVAGKPVLASADAVRQAKVPGATNSAWQQQSTSGKPDGLVSTPSSRANSALHQVLTLPAQQPPVCITRQQQDTIRDLCERLGEAEPAYAQMTFETAEHAIAQLQALEEELLLEVDQASAQERRSEAAERASPSPTEAFVSQNEVGALKHAWLQAFLIEGTISEKREQWHAFKERICGEQIDDSAMLRSQYDQLKAALPIHQEYPS